MKIILTGGGTAGHVLPNISLLPKLLQKNYKVYYIGSKNGIEKELILRQNIPYYPISSGKLRRYLSIKNITDAFKVVIGITDALVVIKKVKPDVVFSKGGFVAVPVVLAAKLTSVPVIIHESDLTLGLANKICAPIAKSICVVFPETIDNMPKSQINKVTLTGSPIRSELFTGNPGRAQKLCNFNSISKPTILVMGGSLGAVSINKCLRSCLTQLLLKYNIIHICGKNNVDNTINILGYMQFEYLDTQMPDILALADLIISRAGSNSISEFLALKKPNLLIPLPLSSSRGDQILNARSFENLGYSKVLPEDKLSCGTLIQNINELYEQRQSYKQNMQKTKNYKAVDVIVQLIENLGEQG